MLPDAGWHGFGPGTFALVFPHYTGAQADLIPGIWRYAHDDYLQTLLEWGWAGAIFWALLFFGAMAQLFIHWRKRRDLSTADRVLVFVSGLALAGVAAHAIVDFPLQIASLQLYAGVCVAFGWSSSQWEGVSTHQASIPAAST
jgi:O-antigen ligase